MQNLEVGSVVKALPESNTWMHQYGVVGTITEIFHVVGKSLAKISVPKWIVKRQHGGHIISEWERKKFTKSEEEYLLLDAGIELRHLEFGEMPEQTTYERVDSLLDQAFGFKGKRLSINVAYHPKDLVITPGICVHEGCNQSRTHLAWHNNHGTVEAFMVCEPHYKELNGRCSDGFPLKNEFLSKVA